MIFPFGFLTFPYSIDRLLGSFIRTCSPSQRSKLTRTKKDSFNCFVHSIKYQVNKKLYVKTNLEKGHHRKLYKLVYDVQTFINYK